MVNNLPYSLIIDSLYITGLIGTTHKTSVSLIVQQATCCADGKNMTRVTCITITGSLYTTHLHCLNCCWGYVFEFFVQNIYSYLSIIYATSANDLQKTKQTGINDVLFYSSIRFSFNVDYFLFFGGFSLKTHGAVQVRIRQTGCAY